jgi:hypothetical protein
MNGFDYEEVVVVCFKVFRHLPGTMSNTMRTSSVRITKIRSGHLEYAFPTVCAMF